MDEVELGGLRRDLEGFGSEVFGGFARADQRATGLRYLRGLMLDGQRKSMQPMAARLGVDHQQLQQFLTSSTWDVRGVRRRLAARALQLLDPLAWVLDDTGFAKDGKASACVSRQYSGTLGKVGNCQIAVSLHAVGDAASAVLDWRLLVPQSWDETCLPDGEGQDAVVANPHARRLREQPHTLDEAGQKKPQTRKHLPRQERIDQIRARRAASQLPDDQRYRPKWMMALEMLDELAGWGHTPPVLTADAGNGYGYGQVAEFRQGLHERGIRYIVATTSSTTAHPGHTVPVTAPYAGVGTYPIPKYLAPARTLKDLATAEGADAARRVRWRARLPDRIDPDKPTAELAGHFFALRVRPAGRHVPHGQGGVLAECWLLVEWPPTAKEPSDYWLSDLPADTTLTTLVHLAKSRWRIEHDYRELKTGLGLDHFEGRSWTGWHRHVTLTTAAHIFLTETRLRHPKPMGRPKPPRHPPRTAVPPRDLARVLPPVLPTRTDLTKHY